MAKYCRYCGNELISGRCSCSEYVNGSRNDAVYYMNQRQKNVTGGEDPLFSKRQGVSLSSFSSFITSIRNSAGLISEGESISNPYERNMAIVPECVKPEKNEIVIKQYNIAKLRTPSKLMFAEGRLMVTNRRLLFRAAGTSLVGNVIQEHQFNIDEIGGIRINKDYKFKYMTLLFCILLSFALPICMYAEHIASKSVIPPVVLMILGLLFMIPTFIFYKKFWIKYISSLIGLYFVSYGIVSTSTNSDFIKVLSIILLIIVLVINLANIIVLCFVPNLSINIKTKGGIGALTISGKNTAPPLFGFLSMWGMYDSAGKDSGDSYIGFRDVMPWEDTQLAINELGTMINDLQKHGDYAIDKWS